MHRVASYRQAGADALSRLFVVIGLGRFGSAVARELVAQKLPVLALDADMERVQDLAPHVPRVARCDATDLESLRVLGVSGADVGVVAIGSNLEASIITTLHLKKLAVKQVVARAISPEHGEALQACGAHRVVHPQRDMGVRVAHNLVSSRVKDVIEVLEGVSLLEFEAPEGYVGQTLEQLALGRLYGVTVIGIRRGRRVIVIPRAGEQVLKGDVLVLIGPLDGIKKMEEAT